MKKTRQHISQKLLVAIELIYSNSDFQEVYRNLYNDHIFSTIKLAHVIRQWIFPPDP